MRSNIRTIALPGALTAAVLLSACANMPGMSGTKSEAPATAAPATAPAAKTGPGMNERGEVVDVKKVEAGYGQKVKGRDDLTVAAEFVRHVRNTDATGAERELLAAAFTAARDEKER